LRVRHPSHYGDNSWSAFRPFNDYHHSLLWGSRRVVSFDSESSPIERCPCLLSGSCWYIASARVVEEETAESTRPRIPRCRGWPHNSSQSYRVNIEGGTTSTLRTVHDHPQIYLLGICCKYRKVQIRFVSYLGIFRKY
jgi:hypothetical protein